MSAAMDSSSELRSEQCPAYVLCGGQSARFGTDKARVRINGQPQLLRLASMLRDQGHAVHFVAGHKDRFLDLGVETLVDAQPDCGPIAGLVSAAQHRATTLHASAKNAGWFLLISCDQLLWQANFFEALAQQANEGVLAVTYRDPNLQPIPGLYHAKIESVASHALAQRQLSLKRLLESLNEAVVSFATAENPRAWCFNSERELRELLDQLGLDFEK